MRTALVMTAALAAMACLSACQKPAANSAAANSATGGSTSTASASSGSTGNLSPGDMPHAKPGMWKMTMTNSMMPKPIEYSHCVTPEEASKTDWTGKGHDSHCSTPNLSRGLDGSIHGSATCNMDHGVQMAMDMKVSGDYNSHYTVHMDQTVSGAPMAQLNGKHTMDIDATYMGDCKAGDKGSIHMAN
jgi:Protein of unknown function (DUF3617)